MMENHGNKWKGLKRNELDEMAYALLCSSFWGWQTSASDNQLPARAAGFFLLGFFLSNVVEVMIWTLKEKIGAPNPNQAEVDWFRWNWFRVHNWYRYVCYISLHVCTMMHPFNNVLGTINWTIWGVGRRTVDLDIKRLVLWHLYLTMRWLGNSK